MKKNNTGFTLIELLVVISIIALISSIILADLATARQKAKNAAAQEQVHQVQLALALIASDNGGNYPNPHPDGVQNSSIGYYCIGAATCPSASQPPLTINGTAITTSDNLTEGQLSQFANTDSPLIYQCTVQTGPCPPGDAWIWSLSVAGDTATWQGTLSTWTPTSADVNTTSGYVPPSSSVSANPTAATGSITINNVPTQGSSVTISLPYQNYSHTFTFAYGDTPVDQIDISSGDINTIAQNLAYAIGYYMMPASASGNTVSFTDPHTGSSENVPILTSDPADISVSGWSGGAD